jgi:Rrf2 family protein
LAIISKSIGILGNRQGGLSIYISQKAQYALRAIFELARRVGSGAVTVSEIAAAQAIPVRFLEAILNQLKRGGFVESRRGVGGGYRLIKRPEDLSAGDVLRFVQGPLGPVSCLDGPARDECPIGPDCVFLPMWDEARVALSNVFDGTTFQDLIERDKDSRGNFVPSYSI